MAATEPLCKLIGINPDELSREELFILEAELFTRVCEELKEHFKLQQKDYFFSIKCQAEMERTMETNFVSLVVRDIIATGEYTQEGIACYTQVSGDVIDDLIVGHNTSPSITLFQKIIELHRSVRKELYREILDRIANKFFSLRR